MTVEKPAKRGKASTGIPQNRVKKEQMTSVIWTTPLGLPIVQPYRQVKRKQIHTRPSSSLTPTYLLLVSVVVHLPFKMRSDGVSVNSMKQASVFPPNFIHSLYATQMMRTALQCRVSVRVVWVVL